MFVRRQALRLDIKGWVRNLRDGRVEACASGARAAIEEFESLLKEGPSNAVVDTVTVGQAGTSFMSGEFAVKEDGEKPWSEES